MSSQEQNIRRYFDQIAPEYANRYHPENSYYCYFFNERLNSAIAGLDFSGKTILDIGAGTGALYDYLKNNGSNFKYFACDISSAMLSKSDIPSRVRFVGKAPAIDFPVFQFDLIFMLGVSSYMRNSEVMHSIEYISNRLSPGGKAIISFTHRCSMDFQIRRLLAKFTPAFFRRRLLGQSFSTTAFCQNDVQSMVNCHLKINRIEWQNQTLSPFNHLLPKPSVFFARLLKRFLPPSILSFFSADFLVFFEATKNDSGPVAQ